MTKISTARLDEMKAAGEKIVSLTAYDASFARILDEAGVEMIDERGTWEDCGNGVEAGLYEIRDLMRKGKFKVFSGLRDVFDEILQYHRDDKGKIVKVRDDLLDAIRYAYMMKRESIPYGDIMSATSTEINFASEW